MHLFLLVIHTSPSLFAALSARINSLFPAFWICLSDRRAESEHHLQLAILGILFSGYAPLTAVLPLTQ